MFKPGTHVQIAYTHVATPEQASLDGSHGVVEVASPDDNAYHVRLASGNVVQVAALHVQPLWDGLPSREKDAIISTLVMDCTVKHTPRPDSLFGDVWQERRPNGGGWVTDLPHYTRSYNDAMAVVTRMEQRGYWCQMRTPFSQPGGEDGYWAGFTPHGVTGWNGRPDNWTQAATLTEAICKAAWLTLLNEDE